VAPFGVAEDLADQTAAGAADDQVGAHRRELVRARHAASQQGQRVVVDVVRRTRHRRQFDQAQQPLDAVVFILA
jgi:hypothetical protein